MPSEILWSSLQFLKEQRMFMSCVKINNDVGVITTSG